MSVPPETLSAEHIVKSRSVKQRLLEAEEL